jgi:hypothetical protein
MSVVCADASIRTFGTYTAPTMTADGYPNAADRRHSPDTLMVASHPLKSIRAITPKQFEDDRHDHSPGSSSVAVRKVAKRTQFRNGTESVPYTIASE